MKYSLDTRALCCISSNDLVSIGRLKHCLLGGSDTQLGSNLRSDAKLATLENKVKCTV